MLREVSNGVSTWMSSSPISFVVSFLFGAYVWLYVRLEDLLVVQYKLMKGDEWSRWGVTLFFVVIRTDQFNIGPKDCWWSIMLAEGFHISNVILLTCRTWLIDHSSPTIYIVFQPSNPYLQGLYWWLCFGVHWEAMSTTTIRRGTCRLSSNSFGLERLHSWSRVSSQMDTCVIGQTSTPPPRPNTCFALHNFVMASNVFYWSGLARKFSPLVFLSTAAGYLLQLIRLPESSHRTWNIYWIWI